MHACVQRLYFVEHMCTLHLFCCTHVYNIFILLHVCTTHLFCCTHVYNVFILLHICVQRLYIVRCTLDLDSAEQHRHSTKESRRNHRHLRIDSSATLDSRRVGEIYSQLLRTAFRRPGWHRKHSAAYCISYVYTFSHHCYFTVLLQSMHCIVIQYNMQYNCTVLYFTLL